MRTSFPSLRSALLGPVMAFSLVLAFFTTMSPVEGRERRTVTPSVQAPAALPVDLRLVVHQLRRSGAIALFDFDGTIISEQYPTPDGRRRSGQSAWHLWGARHLREYPYLFPQQRPGFDPDEDARLIVAKDDILEGLTEVESHGYMKFSQIACLEAGMTPVEMRSGLDGFLQEYQPADYVYPVMIDLIEALLQQGTRVWFVSGSNPHFIHATLSRLARQRGSACEALFRRGHLIQDAYTPYDPTTDTGCRIVGNMARQGKDQRFRSVYDDRFTPASGTTRHIVEKAGKWQAFETFIAPRDGVAIGLVAGNSDGDFELIEAALQRHPRAAAILVNPRGKRLETLPDRRCIRLTLQSRKGGEVMGHTYIGVAQNAKLGPLVVNEREQIWILGLTEWPSDVLGKRVSVTGTRVIRNDLPVFVPVAGGEIQQGIPVEPGTNLAEAARRTCLEQVSWQVLDLPLLPGGRP